MKVFWIMLGLCVGGIGICVARDLPSDRNKFPTDKAACEKLIGCKWMGGTCTFSCENIKGADADATKCQNAKCVYCGGKKAEEDICAATKGKCPPA